MLVIRIIENGFLDFTRIFNMFGNIEQLIGLYLSHFINVKKSKLFTTYKKQQRNYLVESSFGFLGK